MSEKAKEPLVIALAGMPACGKGSFVTNLMELLKAWTVAKLAFGDPLRNYLKHMRIRKIGRIALSKLSNCLDDIQPGVLADFIRHEIEKSNADVIILDGARWEYDIDMLLDMRNVIIVFIDAPADVRFERAKKRAANQEEGGKADEAHMTREQFDENDRNPTEAYIPQIATRAHVLMVNNTDDPRVLETKVEDFFHAWVLRRLPQEKPQKLAEQPSAVPTAL